MSWPVWQCGRELRALLQNIEMADWEQTLAELGAARIEDLNYLRDGDLELVGMLLVQRRKLFAAAAHAQHGAQAGPHTWPTDAAAGPGRASVGPQWPPPRMTLLYSDHAGPCYIEEGCVPTTGHLVDYTARRAAASSMRVAPSADAAPAEAAELAEAVREAQRGFTLALAQVLKDGGPEEVMKNIRYAKECVDSLKSSLDIAAKAFKAASRALASCSKPDDSHTAVGKAVQLARDYLVLRVQMTTPLEDRSGFVRALTEAVGADYMTTNILSHLMHAHSKAVGDRFPSSFLSKAKQEALKRGARRPPRSIEVRCNRNRNKVAEPAEEPAAETDATDSSPAHWLGPPPGLEAPGPNPL